MSLLTRSIAAGVGLVAGGLVVARLRRERRARAVWRSLELSGTGERFRPEMVQGLPEPARRYLLHAIEPGTPLARSVRLAMTGSLGLARGADPLPMTSEEQLAPPHGYVWKARVRKGFVPISGFDVYHEGHGEMRWWLGGVIPIVAATGKDLARSAEGRLMGEAIFLPSMLLPGEGARWEAVDASTARVRLRGPEQEVVLTLEVDAQGGLTRAAFQRWNGDPKNGPVGYLPFVSERFADERTFGGYRVPTRFESGWCLGEEGEVRFFFATIDEAEYR